MSRGGARDNAGRKSGWVNLETKLIRVPVAIESQLIAIAKKLDRGESIESETKSIEIESVIQSNLDSVTDSIKEIVSKYRQMSNKTTLKNTRWDHARKLLKELESVLYIETTIESITESKLEEKELVTDSIINKDESVINSEEINDDLVTDSKVAEVKQFELIPPVSTEISLKPLNQNALSKRLRVDHKTVGRKKQSLTEWSGALDPDGIVWEYSEDTKLCHPLNL